MGEMVDKVEELVKRQEDFLAIVSYLEKMPNKIEFEVEYWYDLIECISLEPFMSIALNGVGFSVFLESGHLEFKSVKEVIEHLRHNEFVQDPTHNIFTSLIMSAIGNSKIYNSSKWSAFGLIESGRMVGLCFESGDISVSVSINGELNDTGNSATEEDMSEIRNIIEEVIGGNVWKV